MEADASSTLTVPAAFDALPRCTSFVANFASTAGFPADRLNEIELIVEEIVANICRYGYGERPGTLQICCRHQEHQRLELLFIDEGRPFNILDLPTPQLTVDLDDREVGGLGVPLVRGLIERASYHREGERNLLRLTIDARRPGAATNAG